MLKFRQSWVFIMYLNTEYTDLYSASATIRLCPLEGLHALAVQLILSDSFLAK